MQGENNNAFNRAMKAGGDDSEDAQPYIERSRNNDISKDEDSLAVLSAKQLTNNVGRIFWTKTPTIQMRTTKRFKTPDSSAARTPQMNQVKLVKQALSPDTIIEEAKPATTANTGGEHKIVVEKLEKITKDLELNPKEKNVANPKVLEAWVNETLLEVERVEHSDQNIPWERKQPLRRFGIDRQSLEGSGMSKDRIDRLYRCLFVYSAGFYEFINEMFEHSPNKFNLVGSVWKVFWILLEYCYKSEHQTILDEINKENKEHLERLFKELQKKEKEIKDLELWKEINFANVQRDLEQMRLDKENLLKEKMHLEEDVKINEKAYSDEVQLRIKFENKINDFYANYHDLKVKNTRILEELVVQNRKSEDLAKENSEFRVKNARANEKIIELEGTLKVTLEKLASREATINELTHDKEVIEKKLIDSFKANQTVDLNKLQASFQNANFKLETSSTLNEMYQKNLIELEKLIATKNKDIAYLEERYKTLEKAHEEKCKEALETEKERIKYFDLSNLLQEKLDITTKNLDQRNLEYDELLKDYSSLKHLLNAEREKLEALTEERNAAEENVITLNRVRSQKDEEIAKLEKTLAEEYERMSEMQSQIDDLSREKERLEVVTQEQKQLINDYEEKMKESEVMMTNIKSDMFSNEDHMSKLMNKEKTNQQSIMNKLEEEQEKSKMFQLDIIQLKQVVETGVQERHKCNLKIQDLETQLEAVIKAKEEIQETINGYSTKKDEIEAEKIHEKHAWDLAKNDFEKKINELEKVIEELTAPRERTYHPLVVEDLLSRISRLDLQVTGFESRHYDDLRKLTEANGKIKQAKKIHTQLHALSQKLLKDNVKLQEELENKAFETQRLKALTDFLQQRQEILTMQILDQKEQLKEATPKVKEDGEEGKSALEKPVKGNLGPSLLKKEKEPARSNSSPKKRTDPPQASTFAKASAALQRDSPKHDTDQKDAKTDSLKESISQKDSRLNTSESIDRKSIGPNTSIHIKPNSRPNLNPSPSSGGHSITDQIEKIVKTEKVEKKIPSQTRGLTRESRRSERSFEDKKENERSITKSNESKKSGLTANGSRAAQEFLAGIDYVKRELLNSQNSERSNVSRRNFEKLDTSKDGSVDERKSREESPEVRKVGSLLKERQSSQSIINRDVKSPLSGVKTEKPKSPQEKPVLKPKEPTRAISPVGLQDEKSPGQRKGSPSPPIRPEEREQTPESIRTAGSRHHTKNIPSVEEEKNVSSSSSSDSSSSSERGGSRDRSISSKGTKRSSKKYGRNSKPGSRNKTRGPTGSKEFLTVGNQDKQPIQQRVSFRIEDGSQSPREASPSDGPIFVEEQQHSSQERSHFSRPISVNTDKIQPILMGSDHADEFNKTGESLSKFDRLQATGDFPAIGRAERTIEDTLSPSPSPGNITLDEVDAFYEQQLNIDQIIQIATQQTLNTNKQQSPSYLNISPSGKPRGEDTFNATFNSLRSQLRPAFTGGDNLAMLANQNDLLQDASTIRDGERPSTKSAFDQSFYNSSMKGTIEKSSKSALAPLQKGRPSSQPFENEKTQNKLKEILQGRPGTTQNVVSPIGALHDRARIPTISSQQSHDDGEQSQRVDSQGQPRSITALPPLKQIPPKQLQRGETGNSATFSSSSKKSIERKRQYSIKEGGMQRLESKKSNVSQESSPASSVNMSFQTKSGQRAPTRDLNRTYDVVLDSSLVNSRSESIPEDTRPSARRASGIQVISELDSQRSSLPSTTPVQKAHRAGSLKVPERREKSMKTIEDDDAREQTEEDDKLRRKQKTVSYHKSKTYTLPQTSGQESEYNDQEATDRDQGQDPPALDSEMRALIDALANRVQIEAKEEQMKPKIDLRSLVNKVKGSLTGPKPHNRSPGADRSSKRGSPSYKK